MFSDNSVNNRKVEANPLANMEIDGKNITAVSGQTILQTAIAAGIDIPHLCNDPRMKPIGSCEMCLVEIESSGIEPPEGSALNPGSMVKACETRVADGMIIKTATPAIIEHRKKRLEAYFADHWADCVAPCTLACPAGTDAQGYIGLINQKRYRDAVELIKKTNPFPGIIGRVCTRPCEDACRRNLLEDRVSICWLKRFAADKDVDSEDRYRPEAKPATGKKVAVIGAGPAGLACAYYLAIEGHKPIVFEAMPKPGGMLRYGIPAYRLPKDLLDDEVNEVVRLGAEINYNKSLGKDFTLEELQKDYDAVFLGIGAQSGTKMWIDNEDTPGVMSGVDFLRSIGLENPLPIGKKVAVVGGGNVAIDCARSALRLGAEKVYLIYRRGKAEMPAHDIEIEEAEHEGVELVLLANPTKVIGDDKVTGVECVRMALGEPDASGRRRPEPQAGSEFILEIDNLIAAIGQAIDKAGCEAVMDGKYMAADNRTMQTAIKGVFAAGDAVTGPNAAIQAVAGGRDAAFAIVQYLGGKEINLGPAKPFSAVKGGITKDDLPVPQEDRVAMPAIHDNAKRIALAGSAGSVSTSINGSGGTNTFSNIFTANFVEVETGFTEEDALKEAHRCLECGCIKQNDCDLRDLAIEYEIEPGNNYDEMRHYETDSNHPIVLRNPNKCIQCKKCVTICDEVVGVKALEYRETDGKGEIIPAGDIPLLETKCEACGQCISACPTAALVENRPKFAREFLWPPDITNTTCSYCGVGCSIQLNTDHTGKVFRVTTDFEKGVNKGNLCAKGRFGYPFISHPDRLTTPLIKKDGVFVEASWGEAIKLIADKFSEIKTDHGSEAFAGLSSARCTNEENYLFQKLVRGVLGTNNVDHCARL
jgi:formate dehydrogenase major subunit